MNAICRLRLFGPVFAGAGACCVISASCPCQRRLPQFVFQVASCAGFRCFVFWFSLLPRAPPICLPLLLPGSGVILSRCLVAFPGFGFCRWPMRPDCCVSPVASLRCRLPGFSTPVVCVSAIWRCGVPRFRRFVLRPRFFLCDFL